MELLVRNIKCSYKESEYEAIASYLRLKRIKYNSFSVYKKSVDARKRDDIKFVITALVEVDGVWTGRDGDVTVFEEHVYPDPKLNSIHIKEKERPIIAGFGPAGMFCALLLARCGYRPIVLERGEDIDKRTQTVDKYLKCGVLNTNSNIQFGEGGAGAFSDGKLITRINDKRTSFVLKTLHEHGAPKEILVLAKPHVGTDLLKNVVKSIRQEIISLGGEVHFSTTLTDVKNVGEKIEIEINGKDALTSPALFIATGHSSHDTYKMLLERGFDLRGKDFSVGVRIEHKREDVERSLYGRLASDVEFPLPSAEYSVSMREGNRGVYSFCMCPGGLVMASASDPESIVTNGMSYHSRNEANSNAAIAVSVLSSDYGNNPLKAIEYQKSIERAAWAVGRDNRAPSQTVGDFLDGRITSSFNSIEPSYPHGVIGARLDQVLPKNLSDMLKNGLRFFGRRHSFFSDLRAPLTGVETRTSSPIRIARKGNLEAEGFKNIFPCGEGAGWAGGITSAAIDGLRAAESYILGEEYDK